MPDGTALPGADRGRSIRADGRRGATLALVAAIFSAVFLLALRVADDAPRDGFVFALLIVATFLNIVWAIVKPEATLRVSRFDHGVSLALAVFTILGNICVAKAITLLGTGMTGVFIHTQILMVAAGQWIFLGERVSPVVAVGAVLAVAGLVTMQLPETASISIDASGILWALGGAASFSAMLVLTRGVIGRIQVEGVNSVRLVYAILLFALIPGAMTHLLVLTPVHWLAAAGAAIAGPFVSRLLQMHCLRYITAAQAKLIVLSAVLFAFAFDFVFFGVVPTALEAASAALVFLGILIPAVHLARRS